MKASEYVSSVESRLSEFDSVAVGVSGGCADCGTDQVPCEACEGTGEVDGEDCLACDWTGKRDWQDGDSLPHDCLSSDEFRVSSCDSCGSGLAGERHYAHGLVAKKDGPGFDVFHLDVCTDCLLFLANGDLPETCDVEG